MDFNTYDELAETTAIYPGANGKEVPAIVYTTLGLVGEAGEIANKVKKILRDDNGVVREEVRDSLFKEAGDVLWYLSRLNKELDRSLDESAHANYEKLKARKENNTISGVGDDR